MITRRLRFGYLIAVGGLAAAIFGTIYAKWPFIFLSIYFALCWLVWFACAVRREDRNIAPLLGLWILIDIGILVHLAAFEHAYGHGSLSGVEFLYAFSYAPVLFPSGFILPFFDGAISNKWHLWQYFGATLSYVLPDWITATLISATQSALVVWGIGRVRRMCRSLTSQSTETGA